MLSHVQCVHISSAINLESQLIVEDHILLRNGKKTLLTDSLKFSGATLTTESADTKLIVIVSLVC